MTTYHNPFKSFKRNVQHRLIIRVFLEINLGKTCFTLHNYTQEPPLYSRQPHLFMLLIHCPNSGRKRFFSTYLWMWHYGSSFLPRCLRLCNLPRTNQHSLQLCTVASSRHCAALWCVQHVPYLRLSQYCMKSHQSVALYHWIITERNKSIHERSRDFSSTITFYLTFKGLGSFTLFTWM